MSRRTKFYAVLRGRRPGVYDTWEACREQVDGFSDAQYRAFSTKASGEKYLKHELSLPPAAEDEPLRIEPAVAIPLFEPAAGLPAKRVVIFSDGACIRNPGPGGYGVVIKYKDLRKELSAGFRLTTNNRMEMVGCIAGLLSLKESCEVTVYSDSKYVVDAMSKAWALKWRRNGWKRRDPNGEEKPVLNQDLWIQMLDLCDRHRVQFQWIRGHAGHEENERCDELARAAACGRSLGVDAVYEKHPAARS